MDQGRENSILAKVTLITSFGDFLSLFAVMVLIQGATGNLLLASYVVPVKSLGIALGGVTLPSILNHTSTRSLMIWTQIASFFLLLALVALTFVHPLSTYCVLAIVLCETILKQFFEGAREIHSRLLGDHSQQRALQAEILHGIFGAQMIGPVVSFFLIRFLPIQIPLFLDAASFLAAGIIATQLRAEGLRPKIAFSALRPLTYLQNSRGLFRIFLLRSVGYWIPVGIFNYLLFSVVTDHYGLKVVYSTWVYAAIGLGSIVATTILKDSRVSWGRRIRSIPDARLAAIALALLAVTRIGYLKLPSIGFALAVVFLGGICNGVNAVTTQSLRRKLTSDEQFPEIVGLELVIGKLTDWGAATIFLSAMSAGIASYSSGILLSAAFLVVLAILHLNKELIAEG